MGRRRKAQNIEGLCDICEDMYEGAFFNTDKFIDGKPYSEICYCCGCVPKFKTIDDEDPEDGGLAIAGEWGDDLHTLIEMVEDGFEEEIATQSIKAVGSLLGMPRKQLNLLLKKPPKAPRKRKVRKKK